MNWEVLGGVIAAICAIASVLYFRAQKRNNEIAQPPQDEPEPLASSSYPEEMGETSERKQEFTDWTTEAKGEWSGFGRCSKCFETVWGEQQDSCAQCGHPKPFIYDDEGTPN